MGTDRWLGSLALAVSSRWWEALLSGVTLVTGEPRDQSGSTTPSELSQTATTKDDVVLGGQDGIARTSQQEGRSAKPRTDSAKHRFKTSSASDLLDRLNSIDYMDRGILFAGVLLLCFIPFVIVVNSLFGNSAVGNIVRHLGLNQQASADVSKVFTSPTATSSAISGTGYVLFIFGGIAGATAVQDLYGRAFDVKSRGFSDIWRRLIWLAVLIGLSTLGGWAGKWVRDVGSPVLLVAGGLANSGETERPGVPRGGSHARSEPEQGDSPGICLVMMSGAIICTFGRWNESRRVRLTTGGNGDTEELC